MARKFKRAYPSSNLIFKPTGEGSSKTESNGKKQKGSVRPVGIGKKEGVPIIFRSPNKLLVKT